MKKILVIILAYNAEAHIGRLLARIPASLIRGDGGYVCEFLLLDDASPDKTFAVAKATIADLGIPVTVLRNPINQGYGGNQKIGYSYAIAHGYDAVAMLHGDGQYPPEMIEALITPLLEGKAEAVLGSRMLNKRSALRGRMPLYKFVGNIVLTRLQNVLLGSNLSEFHTGFRAYSVAALSALPFTQNANDFAFDTDILIQFLLSQKTIAEIPIPTHYGDEVCHVNGWKYAYQIVRNTIYAKYQKLGIFYQPKFDFGQALYRDKSAFASSHSWALARARGHHAIVDMSCARGMYLAHKFAGNDRRVHTIDGGLASLPHPETFYRHVAIDANDFALSPEEANSGAVLLLDVVEHLTDPERFMQTLRAALQHTRPVLYITTPNIAFFLLRLSLLFGQFNYGKHGILDRTHKRLFTFSSFRRFLENQGYEVKRLEGIPAPFPLAVPGILGMLMLKINQLLILISKRLFSFQMAFVARPLPTVEALLDEAKKSISLNNPMR